MSRFPKFFSDVGHLPTEISAPHELTSEESLHLAAADRIDPPYSSGEVPASLDGSLGPPAWLFPEAVEEGDDRVFDVVIPQLEEVVYEPRPSDQPPDLPSGSFGPWTGRDIDAVAFYAPWHFYGEDWGIYLGPLFPDFLTDIAFHAVQPISVVEPFVVEQLLAHEQTHFEFEVVATELEAMVERSLYREYLFFSYNAPNRWASPLEEAVATWEEVAFARRRTPRRPKGFLKAVQKVANLSPPGYRDWKVADDDRRGPLVRATVASHIIGQRLLDWPWGDTSPAERAQVPVRYRGDPQFAPSFIVPKALTRPTVRDLERFLRRNGAEIDKRAGKGSHRKFRWRGQAGSYATGRPVVPKPESRLIANIFGFRGVSELYKAIAESRIIP